MEVRLVVSVAFDDCHPGTGPEFQSGGRVRGTGEDMDIVFGVATEFWEILIGGRLEKLVLRGESGFTFDYRSSLSSCTAND
jgi:hypothetical protein